MANYGTVVGYFPSQSTAEAAISALKMAGFKQNQIGVAARSGNAKGKYDSDQSGQEHNTVSGKTTGMWDKVKSFFEGGEDVEPYAGEATGQKFNDREVTPQAYGSQDVDDSLQGMSVPNEHARYFGHRFGGGDEGAIVTVSAQGREEEAAAILKQNGADLGEGAATYDYSAKPADKTSGQQDIQLYGEVLRVQKERVSRGEVRLRKEVHTTMQTIEVPVTREELVIDRVPVTGEQVATGATFAEQEIRIPLSEERAMIDKQAVVREQIRVGKKEVTNTESFKEQVRSEDLKIDEDSLKEDTDFRGNRDIDDERAS